jgi:hypothetical protein
MHSRLTRAGARCAFAICLALVFQASAPAQEPTPAEGGDAVSAAGGVQAARTSERITELLRMLAGERAARPESVGVGIAELGPGALPVVLRALDTGRWTRSMGFETIEVVALGETERLALQLATQRLGRQAVLDLARAAAAPEADDTARGEALAGLAVVGRADDLKLALEVVRAAGLDTAWGQRLVAALERSVEAIVRRDASAARAVALLLRADSSGEGSALIRGCAAGGQPEALVELGALVRLDADWTPILIQELVRAAANTARPIDPLLLNNVRYHLGSPDLVLARAAAGTLAGLGDFDSAPNLIEMLESPSPQLRDAARKALVTLTGLNLGEDRHAWERWLQGEILWFEGEAPQLIAELETGTLGRRTAALSTLAGHRYRRDQLASAVLLALDDEAPGVRRLACSALAGLGCASSARGLVELLGDPDPGVAQAAWKALTRVTGKSLAPERALWIAALEH